MGKKPTEFSAGDHGSGAVPGWATFEMMTVPAELIRGRQVYDIIPQKTILVATGKRHNEAVDQKLVAEKAAETVVKEVEEILRSYYGR